MNRASFPSSDLRLSSDASLVEFVLGGPSDGEFRPANENGLRASGMYVPVNDEANRVVARRWVPQVPAVD